MYLHLYTWIIGFYEYLQKSTGQLVCPTTKNLQNIIRERKIISQSPKPVKECTTPCSHCNHSSITAFSL